MWIKTQIGTFINSDYIQEIQIHDLSQDYQYDVKLDTKKSPDHAVLADLSGQYAYLFTGDRVDCEFVMDSLFKAFKKKDKVFDVEDRSDYYDDY